MNSATCVYYGQSLRGFPNSYVNRKENGFRSGVIQGKWKAGEFEVMRRMTH